MNLLAFKVLLVQPHKVSCHSLLLSTAFSQFHSRHDRLHAFHVAPPTFNLPTKDTKSPRMSRQNPGKKTDKTNKTMQSNDIDYSHPSRISQYNEQYEKVYQKKLRPKQSLGQNFLVDHNMIRSIVDIFQGDQSENGRRVIEVGPGMGALTKHLVAKYPSMLGIEIDQRAVEYLQSEIPSLSVKHEDVLKVNWKELAENRGGKLTVIGNLPYNIVSQILFGLFEYSEYIDNSLLMMQLEVAQRITSRPNTKDFGILAVIAQLHSQPKFMFKVPNTVFYPKPDVTSAMVMFTYKRNPRLDEVSPRKLRLVIKTAFNQRRKMLSNSMKSILIQEKVTLPPEWASRRPEQLEPETFIDVTKYIFGGPDPSEIEREKVWISQRNLLNEELDIKEANDKI